MLEWLSLSQCCQDEVQVTQPNQTIQLDAVITCAQRFCPSVSTDEKLFDEVVELIETTSTLLKTDRDRFASLSTSSRWELVLKKQEHPTHQKNRECRLRRPCLKRVL